MDKKVADELELIKNVIVETVPVEQIWLFGSYAYGTPNKESDLDIYVVLKDDAPMRPVEAGTEIGLALYEKKSMATDILVLKKERFDYRQGALTLEHEVASKGVLIYG
ncbi:nucleotidyltransferase domain-containing protein [Breznakiellaceae bacterium SP9]